MLTDSAPVFSFMWFCVILLTAGTQIQKLVLGVFCWILHTRISVLAQVISAEFS
jgi:hypothetical protein